MMRSRTSRSRSARYPRHWPFAVAWSVGLLLSGWLLVALAYVVGRKRPENPTAVPEAVLAAASSPGTTLGLAFASLMLGAWCLRHLCLHWLAWTPGRIEVAEFKAGTRVSDADVAQHTITFRRMLATLRLQAPAPVPGAAPEGDFLDVLGRSGADSRNVLGTLLNVLRAAVPTHAYELHGVLQERDERPHYGVTVQLLRLPTESSLPVVVWDDTWDDALRRAADDVTALILPRTRRCRAPWGAWRRHEMPRGLLHAYEEATRLEQQRRYDEALHQYFAAMELDPLNMVLRLRVGQLQERLGLYLDALATYSGMLAASKPAGVRLPSMLYRGHGRRERRRALLSARYRRNVLLGGRALADQWAKPSRTGNPTRRDEQRERLRICLTKHLSPPLVTFARRQLLRAWLESLRRRERPAMPLGRRKRHDAAEARVSQALRPPAPIMQPLTEDNDRRPSEEYLRFRELTAAFALYDCRRLRFLLALRRMDRRTTITRPTIALTEACIRVRQQWVAHERDRTTAQWPKSPKAVDEEIRRIELGAWRAVPIRPLRARTFTTWHEHYNAACAYALPLQARGIERATRDELAVRAVRRLEQATTRADSAYIASRRDWLLSEDPDLIGLRTTDHFKYFELMYLPASDVTPRRPKRVQHLECSRYVRALLTSTAERWQAVWHERGRQLDTLPELKDALDWFADELRMWEAIRIVATEHRHSGSRRQLVSRMRECSGRYGFEPLPVAYPRYEHDRLPETARSCDTAADAELRKADDALEALGGELHTPGPAGPAMTLLDDLRRWQSTLQERSATAREPSRWLVAALCDHHAALWQLLALWMRADVDELANAETAFRAKAKDTRELWSTTLSWWRAFSPVVLANGGKARLELLLRYQLRSLSQRRGARPGRRADRNGHAPADAGPTPARPTAGA